MTKSSTHPNLVLFLLSIIGIALLFPISANAYPNLIPVCHKTRLTRFPWVAIRIPKILLNYHLNHGDFLYEGLGQSGAYILSQQATQWCVDNEPSSEPPSVSLFTVSPQCQTSTENFLIRIENPTIDTINYRIGPNTSTMIISNFLPPAHDGQPSMIYHILPTNQSFIMDNFQYIFDENGLIIGETILSRTPLYFSSTSDPFCSFLTYCYNGTTYSLVDSAGVVSYPPEGSTDGACTQ